jgi:hypothetical protein
MAESKLPHNTAGPPIKLPLPQDKKYHPLFPLTSGVIVLASSDGVRFCVPKVTLQTASPFFRHMFSLPRPQEGRSTVSQDVLPMQEPGRVVEQLLKMISGLVIQQWESTDDVEEVLLAAEKYQMHGPISLIRTAITSDQFRDNPFWIYAIATRFGWEMEAKLASRLSLEHTIHDDKHTSILSRLSSTALRQLYHLHGTRYRQFRDHLETKSPFSSWRIGDLCHRCSREIAHVEHWYVLKDAMLREMERTSSGITLLSADTDVWQKLENLLTVKCSCGKCPYFALSSSAITTSIKSCLSKLPSTV